MTKCIFVAVATELAHKRKVGDSFKRDVQDGPWVDVNILHRTLGYIESETNQGAALETRVSLFGNGDYFIEPTVSPNVTDNMDIAQEEVLNCSLRSMISICNNFCFFSILDFWSYSMHFKVQNIGRSYRTRKQMILRFNCGHHYQQFWRCYKIHASYSSSSRLSQLLQYSQLPYTIQWIQEVRPWRRVVS